LATRSARAFSRHIDLARPSARQTGFCGVDHRRNHRAFGGAFLLWGRNWRGIPASRRPLRFYLDRASTALGIPLALFGWMSSFLDRPVAMATLVPDFCAFFGLLFSLCGSALFHTAIIGRYEFSRFPPLLTSGRALVVSPSRHQSLERENGGPSNAAEALKMGTIVVIVAADAHIGKYARRSRLYRNATPLGLGINQRLA